MTGRHRGEKLLIGWKETTQSLNSLFFTCQLSDYCVNLQMKKMFSCFIVQSLYSPAINTLQLYHQSVTVTNLLKSTPLSTSTNYCTSHSTTFI